MPPTPPPANPWKANALTRFVFAQLRRLPHGRVRATALSFTPTFYVVAALYVALFVLAVRWQVGAVYFLLSSFVLIFTNLRDSDDPSAVSAYSVFNRGFRELAGQFNANTIERVVAHRAQGERAQLVDPLAVGRRAGNADGADAAAAAAAAPRQQRRREQREQARRHGHANNSNNNDDDIIDGNDDAQLRAAIDASLDEH